MVWEFWSKQLDEEELVENGEFDFAESRAVCTKAVCLYDAVSEK